MIDVPSHDLESTSMKIAKLEYARESLEAEVSCLRFDLMLAEEKNDRLQDEIEHLRRRLHSKRMRHH